MDEPPVTDPKMLSVRPLPGESKAGTLARYGCMPTVLAGFTIADYSNIRLNELTVDALIAELRKQCDAASRNDLARADEVLVAQAHTLDAIFNQLAQRAATESLASAIRRPELHLETESLASATPQTALPLGTVSSATETTSLARIPATISAA